MTLHLHLHLHLPLPLPLHLHFTFTLHYVQSLITCPTVTGYTLHFPRSISMCFLLHAYLPPKKWIELFDWTPFMNSSIFIFLMCSNTAQQKTHGSYVAVSPLQLSMWKPEKSARSCGDQVGWWCQLIFCLARSVTHLPSGKLSCHGEVSRNVKKMEVSWNRATPSYHTFLDWDLSLYIWVPPFFRKTSISYPVIPIIRGSSSPSLFKDLHQSPNGAKPAVPEWYIPSKGNDGGSLLPSDVIGEKEKKKCISAMQKKWREHNEKFEFWRDYNVRKSLSSWISTQILPTFHWNIIGISSPTRFYRKCYDAHPSFVSGL